MVVVGEIGGGRVCMCVCGGGGGGRAGRYDDWLVGWLVGWLRQGTFAEELASVLFSKTKHIIAPGLIKGFKS